MRYHISIGERKLETEIRGIGEKTVVILPGMNSSIDDWNEVIRELSDVCRVICFHRAGCGESDPNPFGPSVIQTVRDLQSLLVALQIYTPIILVGHSYGGLCVQRFAREYPDSVSGVVLIDSTSVDLDRLDSLPTPSLNEQQSDDDWIAECKRSQIPKDTFDRISRFYTNPTLYNTMLREVEVWYQCAKDTKESGHFPDVPLIVIARDPKYCVKILMNDGIPREEAELFEQTWHDLILEQSDLSGRSQFITAMDSTHSVYEERPEIIVQAIKELIQIC